MILLKMNIYFNKTIKSWQFAAGLGACILVGFFALRFAASHWNMGENTDKSCPPPTKSSPLRIASTSLAGDEILVRILTKAGATERLVAVSAQADNPTYSHVAQEVSRIIPRVGDNLEALASLKPDLVVFASFNRPAVSNTLKSLAVQTCWLDAFESLDDIRTNIMKLGAALGLKDDANAIADTFQREGSAAARATQILAGEMKSVPKTRVLSFDGSGTVMAGKTTFDDLVRLAGGINAASAAGLTGWPRVTAESLASLAPDIIVLLTDTQNADSLKQQLRALPGWRDTPAVKNHRYVVPSSADLLALSPDVLNTVSILRAAFFRGPSPKRQLEFHQQSNVKAHP